MTPLAWCGSHLAPHSVAVGYVAHVLFEEEWGFRARLSGVPAWALDLAALGHDIGKAAPRYQEGAVRACARGEDPSFRLHELFSAIAIAWLGAVKAAPPEPCYVAAVAVWEHHHGMPGRLVAPERGVGSVGGDVVRDVEAAINALLHTIDFAGHASIGWRPRIPLGGVEPSPSPISLARGIREFKRVVEGSPRLAAAAFTAAGMVSVADTVVAAIERRGSRSPVDALRGRYAYRYLRELMGGESQLHRLLRLVADVVSSIHEEYARWVGI